MSGVPGRVLAIDPGRVRMGLALSDPLGIVAQGLPTLDSAGRRKDLDALETLTREKEVATIVVGRPLQMDGSVGPMTLFAEQLAEDLRVRTGLPVMLWDERLSSVEAERMLIEGNVRRENRKGLRDQVAASLILQGFLDSRSMGAGTVAFDDDEDEDASGEDST